MKQLTLFFTTFLLFILPLVANATTPPIVKWTVKNPFEQKVFIENKGQYEITGQTLSKDILFGARQGGLQYYFTNNSIWIKRDVPIKRTEEEIEQLKKQKGDFDGEEKELEYKTVRQFHEINFMGANPIAEIKSDNEVSWYYNFGKISNAKAYKKLTYINLYPGIDMEFYFREDTTGFEYSFIVHPGADVSQIKMQYPTEQATEINGNILIQSLYGNFVDHAPVANQNGNNIGCSFSLTNSIVGFNVGDYDKTKNLIIDPWNSVPKFNGLNDAYDVDWDHAGNCYIYGGSVPWQLIKYDSIGTQLWSYTENFTSTSPVLGDFAVDRNSQSAYIVEGYNDSGAEIIKVNQSGNQVALYPGNKNFREMWGIAFSHCTGQAVVVGGGTTASTYQASFMDTNFDYVYPQTIFPAQYCCHDLWGVAVDNYGNCYAASVTSTTDNDYSNVLVQLAPNLSVNWMVNDGYNFYEVQSVQFAYNRIDNGYTNAFNGLTTSNTSLYTYDSYMLNKWNNGKVVASATVHPTAYNLAMYWSGLTSDDCDHVFVGDLFSVKQYDSNLHFIDSITQLDTIYDVNLGDNGTLYACGAGFVSAITVNVASCNQGGVITVNSPTICSGESVQLIATGSSNYTWSPGTGLSATTGDTVTATPIVGTTYTVTGLGSCSGGSAQAIVTVIPSPNKPTITISVTGDSLISSATQGNQWFFNDTLINGATNQDLIITGTKTGSYKVEVINPANGCTSTSDSLNLNLTGIRQFSQVGNQLSIYPNPFNNTVFVTINSLAQNVKDWSLKLTDVLGQPLFTKPSLNYSNEIDLSNLSSGVYFVTIVNKTGRAVVPVVKQ